MAVKYSLVSESDVKSRSGDKVINKVIRILSASGMHSYLCSGEMGGPNFVRLSSQDPIWGGLNTVRQYR